MTEANTLGYRAYQDDDSAALISKSSWPLKLSGIVFAGLLVIGRSASYGNITWTPTLHQAGSPLIVTINTGSKPVPPPSLPKTSPADPAALSKKSAASEIIQFSPGKNSVGDDDGSNGSGQTPGGASGSGNGTPPPPTTAAETGESGATAGAESNVATGESVNFYTVVESARRHGAVAIGYRRMAYANDAAASYGVVVNPDKSKPVTFSPQDPSLAPTEPVFRM